MKRAYTLVELIFVIVIIGVLSAIGFYSFDPHYLQNDAHMVAMKIEQTRYSAIHYDKTFGQESSSVGCIDLTTLKESESTIDKNYKFHSTISAQNDENDTVTKVCFDIFGRVKNNDSNYGHSNVNITISYKNKSVTLHILKNSGYIDIIY